MSTGLATLAALAVAAALFTWFLRLERRGRRAVVVYAVLVLVLVEAALYPDPNVVPTGIFHPGQGSLSFRLQDIVIPAALLARLLGRGGPRRLSTAAAWWLAFLSWLALETFVGFELHNRGSQVTYEAKAILYIGVFALAAGVPLGELLAGKRLTHLVRWSAVGAAFLVLTHLGHVRVSASIPLVPLDQFGLVGADAATIFVTIGLIALAVGLTREHSRWTWLVAAAPLLVAAAASKQRAAMVGALTGLVVLAVLAALRRDRVHATPTELGLTLSAMVALVAAPYAIATIVSTRAPSIPVVSSVQYSFSSQSKQLSAQSRVNQFQAVKRLIAQEPWFGHGLGVEYRFYDPGPKQFVLTNLTHDIVTDLLLRTGIVGLLFFLMSVGVTVFLGIDVWRRDPDPLVGAFAAACTAALLGLVAKGFVESIFEKYRLAALMGFLIGWILVASSRVREAVTAPVRAWQPSLATAGVGAAGTVALAMSSEPPARRDGGGRRHVTEDDRLRRRQAALVAQERQLEARARAKEAEAARERELLEALRAALDERASELASRRSQTAELEQQLQQRLAELEQATAARESAERRLAARVGELDQTAQRLADHGAAAAAAEDRAAREREALSASFDARVTQRLGELEGATQRLATHASELEGTREALEQTVQRLAAQASSLAAERDRVTGRLAELEAATQQLAAHAAELASAREILITALDAGVSGGVGELDAAAQRLAQHAAKLDGFEAAIEEHDQSMRSREVLVAALDARVADRLGELEQAAQRLAQYAAALSARETADTERQEASAGTIRELQRAAEELSASVAALGAREARVAELDAQVAGRVSELESVFAELQERRDVTARLDAQLAERVLTLEQSLQRLDQQTASVAEREQNLEARIATVTQRELALARRAAELETARETADAHTPVAEELAVRAQQFEQRERELETQRAALEARERHVEETVRTAVERRMQQLEAAAATTARSESEVSARAAELEQRAARLAERERSVEDEVRAAVETRVQELEAREAQLVEREQKADEDARRTAAEQGRALEAREEDIAARERELEELRTRLADERREADEAAQAALAERQERLDTLRGELERRAAEASARAQELEERAARLDALQNALERRAAELGNARAATPAPAPAPVRPAATTTAEPVSRAWSLPIVEEQIAAVTARAPERRDELEAYLISLRPHALPDGSLPERFDALLWEVFGDALDEV